MAKNNFIDEFPDNLKKIISGSVDLFFEKSGQNIKSVNEQPNEWEVFTELKNSLINKNQNDKVLMLSPNYHIGKEYQFCANVWVYIVDAKLIRLEDVTEEDAIKSGIIKTDKGYKHYCPKKLFPKKILDKQEAGFPYMENARSSFFTKWIYKYGILDVSFNPWIWRYQFKVKTSK